MVSSFQGPKSILKRPESQGPLDEEENVALNPNGDALHFRPNGDAPHHPNGDITGSIKMNRDLVKPNGDETVKEDNQKQAQISRVKQIWREADSVNNGVKAPLNIGDTPASGRQEKKHDPHRYETIMFKYELLRKFKAKR